MVYVGVVAQLLSIDLAVVEASVKKQFAKKQKVFDLNFGAVKAGTITLRRSSPSSTSSSSSAAIRPRARSSSTATPQPAWALCSRA